MNKFCTLVIISVIILFISCENSITESDEIEENQILETKLYAYFDSLQVNTPIPGIVAGVWSPDKNLKWVQSFGYANLEEGIPMSSNLKFRIVIDEIYNYLLTTIKIPSLTKDN